MPYHEILNEKSFSVPQDWLSKSEIIVILYINNYLLLENCEQMNINKAVLMKANFPDASELWQLKDFFFISESVIRFVPSYSSPTSPRDQ